MSSSSTFNTLKTKNPKLLFVLGAAFFLIVAAIIIVLAVIDSHKTATIQIIVAPTFATVEIDHHKFTTEGTAKYFPGDYTVNISANGFVSQSVPLELIVDQEARLYVALEPTPENADFYDKSQSEADRLQTVNDETAHLMSEELLVKYPISSILPYEHYSQDQFSQPTGYRIDYGSFEACKSDFCLQVTGYTKSGLSEAKAYIESKGFNPDDYEILFNHTPLEKASPEDFPPEIRKILEEAGYFDN